MEKKQINVEIGQRIQKQRELAGLTQETFSELIGVGVKHLSAIECGANGVSIPKLKRICDVLSISADILLFEGSDTCAKSKQSLEIQGISERLSRLEPGEFKIIKAIVDNSFAALAHK